MGADVGQYPACGGLPADPLSYLTLSLSTLEIIEDVSLNRKSLQTDSIEGVSRNRAVLQMLQPRFGQWPDRSIVSPFR